MLLAGTLCSLENQVENHFQVASVEHVLDYAFCHCEIVER